jgi:predicted Rossmann fold nucleotide-binding protein DprA/Smf involved in DNA uptake
MPTDVIVIEASDGPGYPSTLRDGMGARAYQRVWAVGNPKILDRPLLGFFCSTKCPGEVILQTYDLARALRDAGVPVIGGFHSSMEQECLALLLRGQQPIVICPARSIEQMRLPAIWRQALVDDRLLVLSPFGAQHRRPTRALTEERNRFVAALAKTIFVAYAAPSSKTEALCLELLQQGKRIFVFADTVSEDLLAAGVRPTTINSLCAVVPSGPIDDYAVLPV